MKKPIAIKLFRLAILLLLVTLASVTGAVADDSILIPESKLTAEDDAAAEDQFGFSVAVSGDTMVVGAPYKDDTCSSTPCTNSGAVYLFKSDGNTWVPNDTPSKLTPSDAANGAQFGWAVAIGQTLDASPPVATPSRTRLAAKAASGRRAGRSGSTCPSPRSLRR